MQEKTLDFLPVASEPHACPKPSRKSKFKALLHVLILALVAGAIGTAAFHGGTSCGRKDSSIAETFDGTCGQVDVLFPQRHSQLWANLTATFGSRDYQSKTITWLSEAIQVPTESWDAMGPVGEDPRWEVLAPFHEYLEKAFPLVYSNLKVTKVNTYGIIYEWKGTSPELKPVLFAAHQDVVPVETNTVDEWNYPPFSGHFDGEKIWGRGASDDKSGLIGVLVALETLISHGYQPTRSIVLASGFDEEVSGLRGAATLAPVLQDLYGKNGFAFVIDEGSGFGKEYGTTFAMVGTAEKGYTDVEVKVASAGGHSSLPPDHTSIGILSAMLTHLESNPFKLEFSRDHPLYGSLQCLATHATNMPHDLRKLIRASTTSDDAMSKLTSTMSKDRSMKNLIGTTQAIDLISGGIKANALPEQAAAIVNHRISVTSSLKATKDRDVQLLTGLASQFNLSFTAFGEVVARGSEGSLTLGDPFHDGLEPAPITSTDAAPFQVLSGTIRATFNSHRGLTGPDHIFVTPGTMSGNTDTRYYWDLAPSIFRYNHQNFGDVLIGVPKGIHTVNEYMEADSFMEMIEFFTMLILNTDESTHL
ncbi:hypothetical protein AGABI1DRAFT_36060 [Agaricus bisporus var. burnettii JB137-S8]|uniref:Peptidase M20 dimerisation domain-containing protein n=1 Tax=Agaricus bisporus var. burnettii (strain JB137-S8 / ATCC MYA-4627 / FGSC 10392) TaxID=597362 RepID=K5Y1Y2_AGABU|nr:uncharacterized protein AGABI1DRAFT_36060 [Agaricus bisporus var. burnettii JB137-S8]EKM81840.1 hypothetical protein AGABI1DRAFT_36060 [Agaricus bisporus var. burnettii JB137-S8]